MKQTLWLRLLGIGVLALVFALNLVPWHQLSDGFQASDMLDVLRPAIDLAGGTRLVYQVNTEQWSGSGSETPAQAMIKALRDRVDPNNTKNLIWRPIGKDRIEVTIPRATVGSTRQREAFYAIRDQLLAANVLAADLNRTQAKPTPEARREAFEALARGVKGRDEILGKLADAWENLVALQGRGVAGDSTEMLQATIAYDDLRTRLLATNVSWADVLHVLRMDPARRDSNDSKAAGSKSARELLLEKYASRRDTINEVITAYDAYKKEKEALDDPDDLKRLLKGTGVLEFHIAVGSDEMPTVPSAYVDALEKNQFDVGNGAYRWFPSDDPDVLRSGYVTHVTSLGTAYVLVHMTADKSLVHPSPEAQKDGDLDWKFKGAYPTSDNMGFPAVGFTFDEIGARKFGRLTGTNLKKPLVAVLDRKIISIATIQSMIRAQGQITGNFSGEEVNELCQKLQAGALPGSLSENPISESQIGPQLGEAHRQAGFRAAVWGLVATASVVLAYYLFPLGFVAVLALCLNLLYVLGLTADGSVIPALGFTWTLPGIAGLILSVGMAVDANVLIYERIREEQQRGASMRMAVKNGYGKALSTILDANITTLITTIILYAVGTAEIRGFALVLAVGVVFSVFTAVIVTRQVLQLGIEYGWWKRRFVMAKVVGVPKVRWMDKRYIFWTVSAVLLAWGLWEFFHQPTNTLYDTEFIGGTKAQVTLVSRPGLTDAKLEKLLTEGSACPPVLKGASVHTVSFAEGAGGVATPDSQSFEISVPSEDTDTVRDAIVEVLSSPGRFESKDTADLGQGSLLHEQANLAFDHEAEWGRVADQTRLDNLPPGVFAVTDAAMPQALGADLANYVGGIGVVIDGLDHSVTADQLRQRFRRKLASPDFMDLAGTGWDVIPLAPGRMLYTAAAAEDRFAHETPGVNAAWLNEFAQPQVRMVHDALARAQVLDSISNFNASVAKDAKIQALTAILLSMVAIVIYIWIRFGSWLFGLGAIVPLFHDVSITVGLVALGKGLVASMPGLASALMITDFRFDLTVVAAVLTIIGYSLNDTIVVFDRIRENRGRLDYVTPAIIDGSINQTLSRTLLTSLTTMVAIFIMYVFGGPGIHAFAFAMLVGLLVGTYSSIAVASPILMGWRAMVPRWAAARALAKDARARGES